jgi:hypothetical protein
MSERISSEMSAPDAPSIVLASLGARPSLAEDDASLAPSRSAK